MLKLTNLNMFKLLPIACLLLTSLSAAMPVYDPRTSNEATSDAASIDVRVPILPNQTNNARVERQISIHARQNRVFDAIDNVSDTVDQAQEIYGIVMRLFETVSAADVFNLVKCTTRSLPLYVMKDVIDSLGGPWAIVFGDALQKIDEQKVIEILNILGLERVGKLVECTADIAPKVIAALTPEAQNYLANLAQQYLPDFVIEDFENSLNRSFRRNFLQSVQNHVESVVDWVQDLFDTIKRVFKALSFRDLSKLIKCTSKSVSFSMLGRIIDTLGGVWNIVFGNALSNITREQINKIIDIIGIPVLSQFIDCSAEVAPKIIAALGPEATSWLAGLAQEHLPQDIISQFGQALAQVNGN